MKLLRLLCAALLVLALASCGTSRKAAGRLSTEDYIKAELSSMNVEQSSPMGKLLSEALTWQGVPYRSGGRTRAGCDCSGFVCEVYESTLGVKLPRRSADMADALPKVKKKDLKPGDLVFFITGKKKKGISHVGIYLGEGRMIHTSSSRGVVIDSMEQPYFRDRFAQASRVPGRRR